MTLHPKNTLLELIQAVSDSARNDDEVVATVAYLINSGRVRLCSTFAGAKIALRHDLEGYLPSFGLSTNFTFEINALSARPPEKVLWILLINLRTYC